jgi:hypothetical protein
LTIAVVVPSLGEEVVKVVVVFVSAIFGIVIEEGRTSGCLLLISG